MQLVKSGDSWQGCHTGELKKTKMTFNNQVKHTIQKLGYTTEVSQPASYKNGNQIIEVSSSLFKNCF